MMHEQGSGAEIPGRSSVRWTTATRKRHKDQDRAGLHVESALGMRASGCESVWTLLRCSHISTSLAQVSTLAFQ